MNSRLRIGSFFIFMIAFISSAFALDKQNILYRDKTGDVYRVLGSTKIYDVGEGVTMVDMTTITVLKKGAAKKILPDSLGLKKIQSVTKVYTSWTANCDIGKIRETTLKFVTAQDVVVYKESDDGLLNNALEGTVGGAVWDAMCAYNKPVILNSEEPALTNENMEKSISIDNLKKYKQSDNSVNVTGSCGNFSIDVNGIESTYRSNAVNVSKGINLSSSNKKYIFVNTYEPEKGTYQLGDWFSRISCISNNDEKFIIIESYLNMGARNDPSPYNYVINANSGKLVTEDCDEKCIEKYFKNK